jgi:response regulator RpfG family c-di-GMP phosphodiesterase
MVTAVTDKTGFKFSLATDGEYCPADDYVSKPVPASELPARVKKRMAERVQGAVAGA